MKKFLCKLLDHDFDNDNTCIRCKQNFNCLTCYDTRLIDDFGGYAEFCPDCFGINERNKVYSKDKVKKRSDLMGIYIEKVDIDEEKLNIKDEKAVVIHFNYIGDQIEFNSKVELTGNEYKRSSNGADNAYLVQCILERELNYMVSYLRRKREERYARA